MVVESATSFSFYLSLKIFYVLDFSFHFDHGFKIFILAERDKHYNGGPQINNSLDAIVCFLISFTRLSIRVKNIRADLYTL